MKEGVLGVHFSLVGRTGRHQARTKARRHSLQELERNRALLALFPMNQMLSAVQCAKRCSCNMMQGGPYFTAVSL
jgi:hypothetical protein